MNQFSSAEGFQMESSQYPVSRYAEWWGFSWFFQIIWRSCLNTTVLLKQWHHTGLQDQGVFTVRDEIRLGNIIPHPQKEQLPSQRSKVHTHTMETWLSSSSVFPGSPEWRNQRCSAVHLVDAGDWCCYRLLFDECSQSPCGAKAFITDCVWNRRGDTQAL